jgi:hypothetical protein
MGAAKIGVENWDSGVSNEIENFETLLLQIEDNSEPDRKLGQRGFASIAVAALTG